MGNIKIGILKNEDPDSVLKWIRACEKFGIQYDVINVLDADWLGKIKNGNYDFFLLRPPGNIESYKKLYDERIYIISKVLNLTVFPSYEECYIYENKKLLSDYLDALALPHPLTHVFHIKNQALLFSQSTLYPIVAKTTIGASGSGVTIIHSRAEAERYIKKAFSSKGIKRRYGPNRAVGSPKKWFRKALQSPAFFIKKLKQYFAVYKNSERNYVIFQEYIPHEFEWRAVKIGDSYFAHKKVKYKDKASGSKGIDYVKPPVELLDFVKEICEIRNFNFMAIDLFEDKDRGYLINELQTIFGHVQSFILEVDGKAGRYVYKNEEWIFEEGDFNTNESYDLRLKTVLDLYAKKLG